MPRLKLDPRGFWFTVHQWTGLAAFLFLVIAGATGSVLSFKPQIDAWLNPSLFRAPAHGAPLSPGEIVRRVEAERPDYVVGQIFLDLKPGRAALLAIAPREPKAMPKPDYTQAFADPVTGALLGMRDDTRNGWAPAHLIRGIYTLHEHLLAGTFGRWLLGVISGLWALTSLVGLYLTLPKKGPFWSKWKSVWLVKVKGVKLPRLFLDLHRASGLWLVLIAAPVAVTGCALNFYSELIEPAAVAISPSRVAQNNAEGPARTNLPPRTLGYDQAIAMAADLARTDGRGMIPAVAEHHPEDGVYRIGITRSGVREYSGYGPVYYYINDAGGGLEWTDDPYRDSAGRAFLRSLYPIHTGQVFGWLTRILVFLLGIAVVEMCVTGVYLWWRKQTARMKATKSAAVG